MQDPKNSNRRRKPWYQRAMEMATLWNSMTMSKSAVEILPPTAPKNSTLWRTISNPPRRNNHNHNHNHSSRSIHQNHNQDQNQNQQQQQQKLKKCTSLRVATSFTRVCLCAPISSYTEVFRTELPPRRSYSYPRSKATSSAQQQQQQMMMVMEVGAAGRASVEGGRRVFRGKSLTDDVLMRRFVVEEEAMMQVRKRNQMEVVRRRSALRRKTLGPSPLRRMVMAEAEAEAEK